MPIKTLVKHRIHLVFGKGVDLDDANDKVRRVLKASTDEVFADKDTMLLSIPVPMHMMSCQK
jgi:hypothetical protein